MKFLVVALLAALCALSASFPQQTQRQISDKQFLERQRDVLRLYRYVNQPSYYKEFYQIGQSYNISEHQNEYSNSEVVQNFYRYYNNGFLQRGEIFSPFYQEQLDQAIALYRLFYYARDYQTFYNTAVWARQNLNEGIFLYSFSVALVHRPDTYGIVIPPIYEVYPYYFFNNEVIQQAYRYKQQYYGQSRQQSEDYSGYTINANYSGYYLNLNPEQSLSYFTEDVGINAFYFYYSIYYPSWLGGQDFNYSRDNRGEFFYYFYQQLVARYYLERLSNGFGEIPLFSWETPFENGYYPSLQYSNGLQFPSRPNYANLYEYFYNYGQRYGNSRYAYSYSRVQDFERRIRDAIDSGYVNTPDGERVNLYSQNGINILGNLIDSNPDSPNSRYYGALQIYARHLLGYSYQPLNYNQVAPSALEQYATSLRDPAFYQFYRRILNFFQQYQSNLTAYNQQDLSFQGVEVTNVQFDRLVTYFDYFYSDLNHAVFVTPQEFDSEKVQVRARQYRLNHQPFNYRITVNSNQEQKASVRIYIGPRYDEYGRYANISQNRFNFVQFDHFTYDLQSGENVIQRNSRQSAFYQNDRSSYRQLYQRVLGALNGDGAFNVAGDEIYFGFPRRFLLPRGSYGGIEYQFYVIVSPYIPYERQQNSQSGERDRYYYPRVGSGGYYVDGYPLGYPFNRPAYYDQIYYNIPNSYVYNARIYHRSVNDINGSSAGSQQE